MNDKLILYGTGGFGIFAALMLSASGTQPYCFCDKKQAGQSDGVESITGLPIISPEELGRSYTDAQIIITAITPKFVDEIYADLKALGVEESRVSQFYSLYDAVRQNDELINFIAYHGKVSPSIMVFSSILKGNFEIKNDIIRFNDLYLPYVKENVVLFDDYRVTLLAHLSGLPYKRDVIGILDSFGHLTHNYLLDDADAPMMINPDDIVIDAGACYGDFSLLAAKVFKAESYAFEPNNANYEKLLQTISLNSCGDKIQAINSGVGSHAARLGFEKNHGASKISGKEDTLVDVTTIDNFAFENGLARIDFIKADIEGHEREMLRGATKTLRDFAPKLSLCTYHLRDDPVVLRKIISKANPDYKFEQRRNILLAWVEK